MLKLSSLTMGVVIASAALCVQAQNEGNDAAVSSQYLPRIPEPMVFDLVRPLGSPKGEVEVNSLFRQPTEGGKTEWAPEIEFTFADGYAFELELPAEGSQLAEYKVAMQGTLGTFNNDTSIHGWQTIVVKDRHTADWDYTALYLNGMVINERLTTMNMLGARYNEGDEQHRTDLLLNNSVFYALNHRVTLGIESNMAIRPGKLGMRLIPQVHYEFAQYFAVQIGAGPSWMDSNSPEWSFDCRLIFSMA